MENSNNRPSGVRGSRSPECEQPLLPQRPNLSPRPQGGILAIACVPLITLINCFLGGAITIAIPDIAIELSISPELELWLVSEIDWLGASVASGSIALLLWGFLDVTRNASNAFDLRTGALFVTSGALMVVFARWQARQQAHGLPRLIDRSMWENRSFWALCVSNFIIWGTSNACEQLINLIFQEVQGKSAIEASLMFLPTPISAIIYDIIIGLILHRVSGTLIVASTNLLASFTPLMLALLDATWSYWAAIFPALLLSSVASDASFLRGEHTV
ncbi:hypothetical protein PG987_013948 [Apiospora arundinis]